MRIQADANERTLLDALSESLPPMHPMAHNTVVLALMWFIWKSHNKMVFDVDLVSTPSVLALLVDHPPTLDHPRPVSC
jgi:hypothetical protein